MVVVSFNTRDALRRCLTAIEPHHEVIVVDNASSDGSPDMVRDNFPHVHLIANAANVGFGPANNQGMEVAGRDRILLLNSDCYADPGAIDALASALDDPAIVGAGGRLRNPDGSLQLSTAGPLTLGAVLLEQTLLEKVPGLGQYWNTPKLLAGGGAMPETEQVMGACLMLRPVERFDNRYFLYCEDTDLCRRLRRHGKIVYVPAATFLHELGASSKREPWRGIARYNRGKELYFRIHHGRLAASICWGLNRLGAFLRLLLGLIGTVLSFGRHRPSRERLATFARVLTCRKPD